MLIICLILIIIILFVLVAYLYFIVKGLCEINKQQNSLNETLGNYIIENKEEIYAIKNSIYR